MEINSDSDDAAGRARRQAKAEGLTLQRSSSSMTGYKGVSPNINANAGYRAFGRRAGKTKYLGTFNIAEERAAPSCSPRRPKVQRRMEARSRARGARVASGRDIVL